MAEKILNNVKQLSDTGGTGPYDFQSTPAGYASFDSQMENGDVTIYCARDGSGAWEVGLGTWNDPPNELTRNLIASSTGSLINWPSTGDREVMGSIDGDTLGQVFMGSTLGIPVRTAARTFATRWFNDGSIISWINPRGTSGNFEIDESGLTSAFLRKDQNDTASGVITFAGNSTFFAGNFNDPDGDPSHGIIGWNGIIAYLANLGVDDYRIKLRVGGATKWLVYSDAPVLTDANKPVIVSGDDTYGYGPRLWPIPAGTEGKVAGAFIGEDGYIPTQYAVEERIWYNHSDITGAEVEIIDSLTPLYIAKYSNLPIPGPFFQNGAMEIEITGSLGFRSFNNAQNVTLRIFVGPNGSNDADAEIYSERKAVGAVSGATIETWTIAQAPDVDIIYSNGSTRSRADTLKHGVLYAPPSNANLLSIRMETTRSGGETMILVEDSWLSIKFIGTGNRLDVNP